MIFEGLGILKFCYVIILLEYKLSGLIIEMYVVKRG